MEESSEGKALVMELVEGETLKGPVPVDTALKSIGLGESIRVHSSANLRLPLVRQPWIGFLSEDNSAGFASGNNFRSKNMGFALATDARAACDQGFA